MVIPTILYPVVAFGLVIGVGRVGTIVKMQCVWILRLKWMIVMNTAQKLSKGSIV